MAGTELLRIANLYLMEVKVDVNENDIVHVSYGDTALIEIDAYFEDEFKGIVTEIANSATSSGLSVDQVTNFKVKIRILPESYSDLIEEGNFHPFRPGMSATVDINTKTTYNVISAPIPAVTTRVDSTSNSAKIAKSNNDSEENTIAQEDLQEVVFVYKDGKVSQKIVNTGIQDSYYIEIIDGLNVGDEVVIAPNSLVSKILMDGMSVEKVSIEELYKTEEK
jgi:HlyD family secretion protein